MSQVIGIDPGKGGAIVVANDLFGEREIEIVKIKDLTTKDLWQCIAESEPSVVVLESVHAGPKMGSSAAFKFGNCFGQLEMACVAAGLRVEKASPQKWQKHFSLIVKGRGLGQGDTEKKNRNKAKAQELFPDVKVTLYNCDALLLARYGFDQFV